MIRGSHVHALLAALFTTIFASPFAGAQEVINASSLGDGSSDRGCMFQVPALKLPTDTPTYFSQLENVVGVGDIDGDGFGDLLFNTGDPCSPDGLGAHEALLLYGRPRTLGKVNLSCNLPRTATFRPGVHQKGYLMRQAAAAAGDLNHDGLADFLFGYIDYSETPDQDGPGRAFLVFGSKDLEGPHLVEDIGGSIPGITFWSSDPGEGGIGYSMANIGDFDGDGADDLAIGCPFSTVGGIKVKGHVHVILKVADLPSQVDLAQVGVTIPGLKVIGPHFPTSNPHLDPMIGALFGQTVSPIGDVDGDGKKDVLVRAAGFFYGGPYKDLHYLVRGSASPPPAIDLMDIVNGKEIEGVTLIERGPDDFGLVGGVAADQNGDGHSDLLLGVLGDIDPLFAHPSVVYMVLGTAALPAHLSTTDLPGSRIKFTEYVGSSEFGTSMAPAGDLNGDGQPDFIVGAPRASNDLGVEAGEVYAIYGRKDFPPEVLLKDGFQGIQLRGETDSAWLGNTVNSAGDFDGDGAPDFVTLEYQPITDPNDEGQWSRAFLVYGTGAGPQPLRIQSIQPEWGRVQGGTPVVIRGTGFEEGIKVHLGSSLARDVRILSSGRLSCRTPPGDFLGFVDVAVEAGGVTRRLDGGFEYTPDFPDIEIDPLRPGGITMTGKLSDVLGNRRRTEIGDLTGDRFDDLITLSLRQADLGQQALLQVIQGGPDIPHSLNAYAPSPGESVISLGLLGTSTAISLIGDVNGDGVRDLSFGSLGFQGYILFGGGEFPPETNLAQLTAAGRVARILIAPELGDNFKMVDAGDLTGDGIDDFAVGYDLDEGVITFVAGQKVWPAEVDLSTSPQVISRMYGSRSGQHLSRFFYSAGDVNGDGIKDFLVNGGSGNDVGADVPQVFVLFGSTHIPPVNDVESSVQDGGGMGIKLEQGGFQLAAPGDVNGDRYADILIGQGTGGQNNQGETYLIFGGPDLPRRIDVPQDPTAQDGVVRILGESSLFQTANVGAAGDFNGDGFQDFLIGDSLPQDPTGEAGNVFLILGAKQLPSPIDLGRLGGRGIRIRSPSFGWMGQQVGPWGDLNGDGQSDFALAMVARPPEDQPSADESRLYVIFGPYGNKPFLRGDASRDGALDISDSIAAINYLFLGGETPACLEAVDTDDNGRLDINDIVSLLDFLYQGGTAPPPPYPVEGPDPTPDDLHCQDFNR